MPGELSVRARVARRLDVALEFEVGISAVVGHSGAGKSTLLAAVAGLVEIEAGRVVLDSTTLFDSGTGIRLPVHARGVGLVFQSLALFPHLSSWRNVAYGIPRGPDQRHQAIEWLERLGVGDLADRVPETLSGGQAQRVALARALAAKPRALLLDEPFSALDQPLRQRLGEELREMIGSLGIVCLLVTHDRADADRLGSRTIVLEQGRALT